MVWKIFGNRQKHRRRRSAWVGQADFGKLGLNRNHSENCHHLSLNSKQKIYAIKLNSAQDTIHHSSPLFSVAAQSIRNICILKVKVIVLKRQLLRALRRIPLHSSFPELVELSGPSSSSSSAEERRVYASWSNDEEIMLLRLWAENFDRRFFKLCKVSSLTYLFHLLRP